MTDNSSRSCILGARRIVIKVGTGVLTRGGAGLSQPIVARLVEQIVRLGAEGKQVVVVSSGAIGAGMAELRMPKRPDTLPKLQATAAVGQAHLIRAYDELLKPHGLHAAQILLTREDLNDRVRYLNARNTMFELLRLKAIPIVNENDTVSAEEIKFGDNDFLAALVANLVLADLVVILSTVEGLLRDGRVVPFVGKLDEEVFALDTGSVSATGRGGMASKLAAAQILTESGIPVVVANGLKEDVILRAVRGDEVGTFFAARSSRLRARRRWIGFTVKPAGVIVVDDGARDALVQRGKSLLASGVKSVEGTFEAGDVVEIASGGEKFARGQANYSSSDLMKIKGLKTSQIKAVLGSKPYDEVVHRDNLALLPRKQ